MDFIFFVVFHFKAKNLMETLFIKRLFKIEQQCLN
jgi:hypothetical protein